MLIVPKHKKKWDKFFCDRHMRNSLHCNRLDITDSLQMLYFSRIVLEDFNSFILHIANSKRERVIQ